MVLWAVLALLSCNRYPDSYPPPEQREAPLLAVEKQTDVAEMGDPDADRFIVSGVYSSEADGWRWTGRRPTLRFRLRQTQNRSLLAEFFVPWQTLAVTGPLTVTFTVNGNPLDTLHCRSAGRQRFSKPVPGEWLKPGENTLVAMEIDKVYTQPPDTRELGVILQRIGFITQ